MCDVVLIDGFVVARMMPMMVAWGAQHGFERAEIPTDVCVNEASLEPSEDDVDSERLLGDAENEGREQHKCARHERFKEMKPRASQPVELFDGGVDRMDRP